MAAISNLSALVRSQFTAAQANGHLTFYQTKVSILHCGKLPFQVRYSPSLANKPNSSKPRDPDQKPFDPFEDPAKELFIADLPAHNLVLNKFPVIPDHFILATKAFKEQTHLLEETDLEAAYQCLKSYHDRGEELFGFFNSGEHSGASQPHRHIQFLPVDSMKSGLAEQKSWDILADSLLESPSLPFTYFCSPLNDDRTTKDIYATYRSLHEKACRVAHVSAVPATSQSSPSPISYNLGITHKAMVLCPRSAEGTKIHTSVGDVVGPIALNGTVLGGTLLVKSEAEWTALCEDESRLVTVLSAIGILSKKSELDEKL